MENSDKIQECLRVIRRIIDRQKRDGEHFEGLLVLPYSFFDRYIKPKRYIMILEVFKELKDMGIHDYRIVPAETSEDISVIELKFQT